jgi:hypothetical protein
VVVDGATCDVVDGADWVYGAGAVVDGVPAGLGVVGVCAQTGAAIARAAAKAVPLKSCFINLTSDMTAPHSEAFAGAVSANGCFAASFIDPRTIPIGGGSAA